MNLYIETNLTRPLMNMFFLYTLVRIFCQNFQNLTPKIEMGTIFWDGGSICFGTPKMEMATIFWDRGSIYLLSHFFLFATLLLYDFANII